MHLCGYNLDLYDESVLTVSLSDDGLKMHVAWISVMYTHH
jgi:hypothetical protein